MGPYDKMFDRNHDGELDFHERVDMDDYYDRINGVGIYENTSTDDDDELEIELSEAGLDLADLDLMDEDEIAEALEDAGLDPDDFDF
ncbi:MAG: uroporphyrin-III methyltransferase [Lachnospiraceae bacterium]|nr:uroporphyrin-III methyltransferase [Lachnospiraceae bacterium]